MERIDKKILIIFTGMAGACIACASWNILFGKGLSATACYLAGSILYSFLAIFTCEAALSPLDYHQSGEGGTAFLTALIVLVLATKQPVILSAAIFLALVIHNSLTDKILPREGRDRLMHGVMINSIVVIVTVYLMQSGLPGVREQIETVMTGLLHTTDPHPAILMACVPTLIILFVLLHILRPWIKTWALGKDYCDAVGMEYRHAAWTIHTARSLLQTVVFMTVGFMGGTALYVVQSLPSSRRVLYTIPAAVLYTQVLLIAIHVTGTVLTALSAIVISHIVCMALPPAGRPVPV